jgi:hypothetical protein
MSRRRIRLTLTLIALGVMGLVGWCALASAQPDRDCTAKPDLRVKVGNQLFAVPQAYLPHILDYRGDLIGLPKRICQRPGDRAIEASQFFIRGFDPYIRHDARTRPIAGVQVEVFSRVSLPDRAWPEEALVQCSGPALHSVRGVEYRRSCQSAYFKFSEEILLNYKFYEGQYAASTWKDLDVGVREFIRSLLIDF